MALTACNDFLDVDAPSKYTTEYVYSNATEINTALNGLYTQVMADNAFGKMYIETLMLNSDVDFKTYSSANSGTNNPRRFDQDASSSSANSAWNAAYSGIDAANVFIYNVENGDILESKDSTEVWQMLGEAKCIRAMFYNELTTYFGDVPAPMIPTIESDDLSPAMQSRDDIRWTMVQDLWSVADHMQSIKDLGTNERFSKESCYGLISRIALNAGGYSLRHNDGDATSYGFMSRPTASQFKNLISGTNTPANWQTFYQYARDAAKKVIDGGAFSLKKTFPQVFIDECNFKGISDFDDPMMEIPFAKEANGQIGYLQGPKCASNNSQTDHNWGEAGGSVGVSHFYPYTFDSDDQRGSYIKGVWQYTYQTIPSVSFSYTWYNNKWSKLWNDEGLGSQTSTKTGINYPYLRYADVLLMFAEAENELDGPTQAALDAVNQVRARAYQSTAHAATMPASKDEMLNLILDERAKEFAGENMRWKDLVRNNKYAEEVYWTFMRYFGVASDIAGGASYTDLIEEHDFDRYQQQTEFYSRKMPQRLYWCYIDNPGVQSYFPQTSKALPVVYYVAEKSKPAALPQTYINNLELGYTVKSQSEINSALTSTSKEWNENILSWDNDGVIKNEIRYSLYGYIRYDEADNVVINDNGTLRNIEPNTYNVSQLPVLRYLLPIPREAITRSSGAYQNYYGY